MALSSGEETTKKSSATGFFLGAFPVALAGNSSLGKSSEWEGLVTQLPRSGILITSFNLSVLQFPHL